VAEVMAGKINILTRVRGLGWEMQSFDVFCSSAFAAIAIWAIKKSSIGSTRISRDGAATSSLKDPNRAAGSVQLPFLL